MATAKEVASEIRGLTVHLVDAAIVRDYHWPRMHRERSLTTVSFDNGQYVADAMKLDTYAHVYTHIGNRHAYNLMMLAFVQFMYRFDRRRLIGHRLAYLPAPDAGQLHDLLGDSGDGHLANMAGRRVVPVPLRIDYDISEGRHRPRTHPKCHLTLGEHRSCRIPVSSPMTPSRFMGFLLRSFYDDQERAYADHLPKSRGRFAPSIHAEERQIVHMVVPA